MSETGNSNAMEPLGCQWALEEVRDLCLKVGTLATDRHVSIRAMMKRKYSDISHQYDVYHMDKSIN